MIAALIQARTNSQRCKNKMLRPFGNTTLIEHALRKFSAPSPLYKLYFATYEQELQEVGKKYPCELIVRDIESATADRIDIVFNYISKIPHEDIMFINSCSPFLRQETVEKAIRTYQDQKAQSLTAVIKRHTWFYQLDGKPINFLDPTVLNTKASEPLYEVTHNIHIFKRDRFIEHTYFWNHAPKDPVFFEIDDKEAIDIDTELDFKRAQALFIEENSPAK